MPALLARGLALVGAGWRFWRGVELLAAPLACELIIALGLGGVNGVWPGLWGLFAARLGAGLACPRLGWGPDWLVHGRFR